MTDPFYTAPGRNASGKHGAGKIAKLGHGDALHVANIDPDRQGLEIFMVHESGASGPYGYTPRDASTGEVLYGGFATDDVGRGMIGQVDPNQRGLQTWCGEGYESDGAFGLMTCRGDQMAKQIPGTNMSIKWSANMTTQMINGSFDEPVTIDDWNKAGRLRQKVQLPITERRKSLPCR